MNKQKAIVVLCSYLPKKSKYDELITILNDHVPTLRMLGLATGYPRTLMTSENGTVIEIFEWESEDAARRAHDHPEVQKIWDKISAVADMTPFNSLTETQKPFAHFKQIQNERTNRVVHFEISAETPSRAMKFYESVFGWEFTQWGENEYWLLDTGREPCPGIDGAILPRENERQRVTNIINVDSVDNFLTKIKNAGGSVAVEKTTIPNVGYVAYAFDTEKNIFGIMQADMNAKL